MQELRNLAKMSNEKEDAMLRQWEENGVEKPRTIHEHLACSTQTILNEILWDLLEKKEQAQKQAALKALS